MTAIWSAKDRTTAPTSWGLVPNFSLKMDSRMLRQLKAWKSWLQASVARATVRAMSRLSFS